jgi:hypothetical protein
MRVLLLALLLLTPSAAALTTISVTTTDETNLQYGEAFSETYGFSFSPTVFDTPIYRAWASLNWDFGTVSKNQVVHAQSDWRLRAEGGYYTNVTMKSYGEKTWFGSSFFKTQVYVNDTLAWDPASSTAGVFGSAFNYEQTHFIIYSENTSALMPKKSDGDIAWDWADAAPVLGNGNGIAGSGRDAVMVDGMSGWFFIRESQAATAARPENNSGETFNPAIHMWLANDTHPTELSVTTFYQDRLPTSFDVTYEFDKELSFFEDIANSDDCDGLARMFLRLVGVCPTLSTVIAWAISFVPEILAFFLEFVSPEAANMLRLAGEVSGEFVAAIVFTSTLIMLAPGKLFFLVAATISGAINLAIGMRGDLGSWFHWHAVAFKWLVFAVFWYFYLYWLLMKFAVETMIKIVDTIGNYIPFT